MKSSAIEKMINDDVKQPGLFKWRRVDRRDYAYDIVMFGLRIRELPPSAIHGGAEWRVLGLRKLAALRYSTFAEAAREAESDVSQKIMEASAHLRYVMRARQAKARRQRPKAEKAG